MKIKTRIELIERNKALFLKRKSTYACICLCEKIKNILAIIEFSMIAALFHSELC